MGHCGGWQRPALRDALAIVHLYSVSQLLRPKTCQYPLISSPKLHPILKGLYGARRPSSGGCPQVCSDVFLSLQFSGHSHGGCARGPGHFLSSSLPQPPELPLPQQLRPAQAAASAQASQWHILSKTRPRTGGSLFSPTSATLLPANTLACPQGAGPGLSGKAQPPAAARGVEIRSTEVESL